MPTWMQGFESVPLLRSGIDDILTFLIIAGIVSAILRNFRRSKAAVEDARRARQAAAYEASTTYQPGRVQTGSQLQPQAVPAQPTVRETAPMPWGSVQDVKPAAAPQKPPEPRPTSASNQRANKASRQKSKSAKSGNPPSQSPLGEGLSAAPFMSEAASRFETEKSQAKAPILTMNSLNRQTMMQAVAWSEVLGSRGGRRGIRR